MGSETTSAKFFARVKRQRRRCPAHDSCFCAHVCGRVLPERRLCLNGSVCEGAREVQRAAMRPTRGFSRQRQARSGAQAYGILLGGMAARRRAENKSQHYDRHVMQLTMTFHVRASWCCFRDAVLFPARRRPLQKLVTACDRLFAIC